jgi:hypothetical protein
MAENTRPVCPRNRNRTYGVLWMRGPYDHYDISIGIGFKSEIMWAAV